MPVEDLYLACACAMGCSRAIDCFHRAYFPDAEAALAAIHAPHLVEEVRQMADEKLFVSRDGNPPRISDYEGQGALRTWFRVIALRLAISLLRKTRKEEPLEDELLLALPARFGDPEFDLIRSHREDFKEAFGEAVAQLPAREKTLLRMHLVDGVSIRQLGDIHRVHPSTVFRWIDRAKAEVARHIRRSLEIRLGLTRAQLESLLEEVRSQLDLSLERVLNQNS
jgi:RNA polymerase sigma-70 factor (ECF subfamily)